MESKVLYGNYGNRESLCGMLSIYDNSNLVIMVHGFGGNKDESHNLFKNFADWLNANGLSSFRYDSTGVLESSGDFQSTSLQTIVSDYEKSIEFILQCKQKHKIRNIGVVGFSLGATAAIIANDKNISAYSFWSPVLDLKKDMFMRYVKNGEYEKAKSNESKKYGKPVSTKMYDSFNRNIDEQIQKIRKPVQIIHSIKDDIIPIESSRNYFEQFSCKKEMIELRCANHSFRIGDDLYHRKKVYDQTIFWMKKSL